MPASDYLQFHVEVLRWRCKKPSMAGALQLSSAVLMAQSNPNHSKTTVEEK
jgi:hypothetical protein